VVAVVPVFTALVVLAEVPMRVLVLEYKPVAREQTIMRMESHLPVVFLFRISPVDVLEEG